MSTQTTPELAVQAARHALETEGLTVKTGDTVAIAPGTTGDTALTVIMDAVAATLPRPQPPVINAQALCDVLDAGMAGYVGTALHRLTTAVRAAGVMVIE